MKGVILAGGLGTRLMPLTKVTNKCLLPVYNKPMIYYPIETFVSSGITDILIVCGGNAAGEFLRILGNGEAFGLKSIWEAIQFCGTERLGHGVRIIDDVTINPDGTVTLGDLAAYVRDRRIPLELCPKSNVDTGAAASIAEHPIGLLRKLNFRVTLNTDNRLMSDTSMSAEMTSLVEAFDYSLRDLEWLTVNGMKSSFLPFDQRLDIINHIIKPGYARLREQVGS